MVSARILFSRTNDEGPKHWQGSHWMPCYRKNRSDTRHVQALAKGFLVFCYYYRMLLLLLLLFLLLLLASLFSFWIGASTWEMCKLEWQTLRFLCPVFLEDIAPLQSLISVHVLVWLMLRRTHVPVAAVPVDSSQQDSLGRTFSTLSLTWELSWERMWL